MTTGGHSRKKERGAQGGCRFVSIYSPNTLQLSFRLQLVPSEGI